MKMKTSSKRHPDLIRRSIWDQVVAVGRCGLPDIPAGALYKHSDIDAPGSGVLIAADRRCERLCHRGDPRMNMDAFRGAGGYRGLTWTYQRSILWR